MFWHQLGSERRDLCYCFDQSCEVTSNPVRFDIRDCDIEFLFHIHVLYNTILGNYNSIKLYLYLPVEYSHQRREVWELKTEE